jgi:Phage integrase, N-terminal SAM-like domain
MPIKRRPRLPITCGRWLTTYAKVNCKLSTYEEYQRAIEGVLIPALGGKALDGLKREHLKAVIVEWIKAGKSRSTVRNYLAPLKSAYFQAMESPVRAAHRRIWYSPGLLSRVLFSNISISCSVSGCICLSEFCTPLHSLLMRCNGLTVTSPSYAGVS